LLGNRLVGSLLGLRCTAHTVDEHTSHNTSSGVYNTHLHSLRDALLVATILHGNSFGGLNLKRCRFHHRFP
jgi:hypothetical protein